MKKARCRSSASRPLRIEGDSITKGRNRESPEAPVGKASPPKEEDLRINVGAWTMRKYVLALALVGICATAASADLDLFYDVRATIGDIDAPSAPYTNSLSVSPYIGSYIGQNYPLQNGGARGDGERVYVSPKVRDYTNPYTLLANDTDGIPEHQFPFDTSIDYSLASINLYASFSGNAGEVISSIGADQDVSADGANTAASFAQPTVTTEIVNTGLWDGWLPAAPAAGGSTAIKLVQVPVIAGPAFDATVGIGNGDTELIATVNLEGQVRPDSEPDGVDDPGAVGLYNVFLSVNNLLCTRVADGGAADVVVNFGYDGAGSPEAGGSGTVDNTTSPTADAVITVIRKGDLDYDGFAATGVDDFVYYAINASEGSNPGAIHPAEVWLSDFDADGFPATGTDDFGYFVANVAP